MASSGSSSGGQRLGGVDDAAARRAALEAEPLAVPGQDRRGGAVDVEDEAGTGHRAWLPIFASRRRSKATLTAPAAAGVGGVLDGLAVAVEGVGGADQPVQAGGVDQLHGQVEAVPAARRRLGAVGVGAGQIASPAARVR